MQQVIKFTKESRGAYSGELFLGVTILVYGYSNHWTLSICGDTGQCFHRTCRRKRDAIRIANKLYWHAMNRNITTFDMLFPSVLPRPPLPDGMPF